MKFLSSQISLFMRERGVRRNIAYLFKFLALVVFMIIIYSVIFHYIMTYEGKTYSWVTGIY
ncbi:MAG: potassium channel protein, partial [Desulfovibrionaceae bacterium]|nr:potassium channel protein [Desulfovibrionaceae bacterium]